MSQDTSSLSHLSRRTFLRGASLTAGLPLLSGLLAACAGQPSTAQVGAESAMPMTADPTPGSQTMSADDMDKMHETGIKAFLAGVDTGAHGNQLLAPKMDGDTKVFDLTAKVVDWQVTADIKVKAWTYNGTMPGPMIRVTEGDKVRVNVKNELEESTAVHFHGLIIPNAMDGVPFITQPPIKPGQSFTYEFTVKNPGSHMYHSHHNSTTQVGRGLLGAFIIEPKDKSKDLASDMEYTMILNDAIGGFTLNGKGFPATEPIKAKKGQKLRVRYMNEGTMIHPMHLHGMPQLVFAKDGWNLPQPYMCDTLNIAPGERWDVIVDCTEPGAWAFHCHILPHAEGPHGMFGMVTALLVE